MKDWLGFYDDIQPTGKETLPYLKSKLDAYWSQRVGMYLNPAESLENNIEIINKEIDSIIPLLIRRKELFSYKQDGKTKEQESQYILHIRRLAQGANLVNLNLDSILIHIVLQGLSDKTLITKILQHWDSLIMQKVETIVKAQETILTCTNGKLEISANTSDISDRQMW